MSGFLDLLKICGSIFLLGVTLACMFYCIFTIVMYALGTDEMTGCYQTNQEIMISHQILEYDTINKTDKLSQDEIEYIIKKRLNKNE